MKAAMNQLQLSAPAYHRILKLARTIADLAGSEAILLPHLAEALQYRPSMSQVFCRQQKTPAKEQMTKYKPRIQQLLIPTKLPLDTQRGEYTSVQLLAVGA
jgi:hypothetical protein